MRRTAIRIAEGILLLLAIALAGWSIQQLFVAPHATTGAQSPVLQPDAAGIDLAELSRRIRETAPTTFQSSWIAPALSNRWDRIVLHHSGSLSGNARVLGKHHRERGMENGLAYHFLIGNGTGSGDGEIEIGPRWTQQLDGGHIKGDALNHTSIGICLVGDFTRQMPSEAQIASLKALLTYLLEITRIPESRVTNHCDTPEQATLCPGYLPTSEILKHRNQP